MNKASVTYLGGPLKLCGQVKSCLSLALTLTSLPSQALAVIHSGKHVQPRGWEHHHGLGLRAQQRGLEGLGQRRLFSN